MKVEYLFSKNDKLGSKIISWGARFENLGLQDNPSHVAVLLNNNLVIESTFFTGVRIIPLSKWIQINKTVARVPCVDLNRNSHHVFEDMVAFWGKSYDWLGIMYFGLKYLELAIFGKKLPRENKWHEKNKYFCTEYVQTLSGIEGSMVSPAKLMTLMVEQ